MIRAVSIDCAFANMGLASLGILPWSEGGLRVCQIACKDLTLIQTEALKAKQVRKSSDDLRRATELHRAFQAYIRATDAQVVFAEVPSGAQSAAAAKYLGAALGILASSPVPVIEVSPMEVKVAVTGVKSKGASKEEVIKWAVSRWPDANWLRYEKGGKVVVAKTKRVVSWKAGDLMRSNEHLADALAIAQAGVATPAFQQLIAMNRHATTSAPHSRPASRRIALD